MEVQNQKIQQQIISQIERLASSESSEICNHFLSLTINDRFYMARTLKQITEMDTTGTTADKVAMIIIKMVDSLGEFTAANYWNDKNQEKAALLVSHIVKNYNWRLSLSGLADCFYKIKMGVSPCDIEMSGFDTRAISIMLSRYTDEFNRKKETIINHQKNIQIGRKTNSSEKVQDMIGQFAQKHYSRFPIPKTFEEQRKEVKAIKSLTYGTQPQNRT